MTEKSLKEKTANGLFWGGLGNGIYQLFSICIGIFLSRILSVTDYGLVGMLMIFSTIAGVIQDGGFAAALINKRNADEDDYNAVFWFSLLTGTSIYILLFFCAPFISEFYKQPELTSLARFIFLSFLIGCTGTVHGAIITKRLMVKEKMVINLISQFVAGLVSVTMAFYGMGYWSIAAQTVIHLFLMVSMIWYVSRWKPSFRFTTRPLKEMLPFSSKIAITKIFEQANQNILSTLLGKFYSPKQVGYYTQGNKWMTIGSSFVNNMVNSVAQPILAEVSTEKERQRNIFRKMLRFISFISFPAMLGLALIAREVIIITVTAKWLPSVPMLQLLCAWGAVMPISSLFSNMIISRGKSNIYMWNTICLGSCQILALIFTSQFSIHVMLTTFVSINIGWIGIWTFFAKQTIGLRFTDILKDMFPYLSASIGVIAATYLLTMNIANAYIALGAKIIIAAGLYTALMWGFKSVIFRECIQFLLKKRNSNY